MKKRKGFTLIELLAVIVILGLLMAIAIPSVTKYITQSRKKTVTTTIGNYIGALTNQVNDMEYTFTATNTVYAVPIECIALERGGTNPFGKWYQANNAYWAYVLVQYDDTTSSYTYGFTFKDSAGYGLYPTTTEKLKESGSQILTDLSLNRPKNGKISNITIKDNWLGFSVTDDTNLVVLVSASEGETGNGTTTCTLCQKGENYQDVENEKLEASKTLANTLKKNNTIITNKPDLTTTAKLAGESGLYVSTDTNSGRPTYFFRGGGFNNYVKFAGLLWRVLRINEDGSVRMIYNDQIGAFNEPFTYSTDYRKDYKTLYYSNGSGAKTKVDDWYKSKIIDKGYDSYVVISEFCEQAKVRVSENHQMGNVVSPVYTAYSPNFKCSTDANGYGIYSSKVGLISYDELIHSGSYYGIKVNEYSPISYTESTWTMTPSGVYDYAYVWTANQYLPISAAAVEDTGASHGMSPVISLNGDLIVTGKGTSSNPYVVQTN